MSSRKLCIVGAGGFGREVLASYISTQDGNPSTIKKEVLFMDDNVKKQHPEIMGVPVIDSSEFDPDEYDVVVAVGSPQTRKKIVDNLPPETHYTSLIHPTAILMDDCEIGEGSIITAGCILTCNIKIGKHAQLHVQTTIAHDCRIGDFFTATPGAHVSGECNIGNEVYIGTNAAIKNRINLADSVTVGMGAVVVKNITEAGVYVGNPARKLER